MSTAEQSLAWLAGRWRTPTAHEQAAIIKFPALYVGVGTRPNPARLSDEKRWATTFAYRPVALAVAIVVRYEHDRTHGTVLWPRVVTDRAGIRVVAEMREQLAPVDRVLAWALVQNLLGNAPLVELQVLWAWAVDQGRDEYVLEPVGQRCTRAL